MQKLILLLFARILAMGFVAVMITTTSMAEPSKTAAAMKIAAITKMYEQDISNQGMDYPVVLQQHGSPELQAAMILEQDYFAREQMSCHIGYDVLWNSQDPNYSQDKQFSVTEQGLVKVSLEQGGDIYYEMACNDSSCQVADVIFDDNTSLKEYLIQTCR